MASYDLTIRGAGIFGLSIAWACLKRGARVQVIDPAGVAGGASGGIVGALAPHTPENWNPKKAFQLESLLMARTLWPEVEALTGLPSGYAPTGRLQPIADDHACALAATRGENAKTLWRGEATWEIVEAAPWAPASATGKLIFDTLSAHINPRYATQALARAVELKGGRIACDGEENGAVIWATGAAGLAALNTATGQPVGTPIKGQAALVRLDRAGAPQLFVDGLHIMPHLDGTVAVGSTTERDFESATETDALLDDVVARARSAVPALAEAEIIQRWAGLRPRARSRAPMLGPWPGRAGHFVANGGFKIGFGMAPKVGEIVADLVLESRDTIPEGFRVEDNLR
ncbi:MAG: FAD-binding oxidoreductase [Pseudomonadota bacterium]